MSKTKKINNRRRKNKTRKTRMMMGGTIHQDQEGNKFVARGNSGKNKQQAKFYNEDLPDLFGLPRNDANALIAFLRNQGMTQKLQGNYRSKYGFDMANISHHSTLQKLGNIISVFIDRKLRTLKKTNEKRQLLQKIKNVKTSLVKQLKKRRGEDEEIGHHLYANGLQMHVETPVETSIASLTEMMEKAGKIKEANKKSMKNDGSIDMAAFVPLGSASMVSSPARPKKSSSMMSMIPSKSPTLAEQQSAFAPPSSSSAPSFSSAPSAPSAPSTIGNSTWNKVKSKPKPKPNSSFGFLNTIQVVQTKPNKKKRRPKRNMKHKKPSMFVYIEIWWEE